MNTISRQQFLQISGIAIVVSCFGGCKSLSGVSDTPPLPEQHFKVFNDQIIIPLRDAVQLQPLGGSVKLRILRSGKPELKLLIIHHSQNEFLAYADTCTHGGRELEYQSSANRLECVSFSHSRYDLEGNVISGPAPKKLPKYETHFSNDMLKIRLF